MDWSWYKAVMWFGEWYWEILHLKVWRRSWQASKEIMDVMYVNGETSARYNYTIIDKFVDTIREETESGQNLEQTWCNTIKSCRQLCVCEKIGEYEMLRIYFLWWFEMIRILTSLLWWDSWDIWSSLPVENPPISFFWYPWNKKWGVNIPSNGWPHGDNENFFSLNIFYQPQKKLEKSMERNRK